MTTPVLCRGSGKPPIHSSDAFDGLCPYCGRDSYIKLDGTQRRHEDATVWLDIASDPNFSYREIHRLTGKSHGTITSALEVYPMIYAERLGIDLAEHRAEMASAIRRTSQPHISHFPPPSPPSPEQVLAGEKAKADAIRVTLESFNHGV